MQCADAKMSEKYGIEHICAGKVRMRKVDSVIGVYRIVCEYHARPSFGRGGRYMSHLRRRVIL